MRPLLCYLLSLSLIFSSTAFGAEVATCDPAAPMQDAADVSFQTACALMKDYSHKAAVLDQIRNAASKCKLDGKDGVLEGAGIAVSDLGTFVKQAAHDAPVWLWNKAKGVVMSFWSDAPDAVSGASAAAEANVEEERSILEKARSLYSATSQAISEIMKAADDNWQKFACLPPEDEVAVVCGTLGAVIGNFLATFGIGKVLVKTVTVGAALTEFLAKAERTQALKGLSASEKLKAASGMMSSVEERGKVLRKVGDSDLTEYTSVNGEKYLKVEDYATNAKGDRVVVSSREVVQDSKTGAIDANQEQGRKLLEKAVQGKAGEDSSVIFLDVNNLGKTNYFKDGTKAGDDYLRGVGQAIKKSVGDQDMVFKLGGDEIAVVVKSKDPSVVQRVAMRLVKNVDENHDARTVFHAEQVRQADRYRSVNKASHLSDVTEDVASSLSKEQNALASKNFGEFKKDYLVKQADAVREQAKYRPSVSIGSTVGNGDDLASVLQRAEEQATQTKIKYKSEIGLDTKKYGGSDDITTRPNYKAKPEVLPPVE